MYSDISLLLGWCIGDQNDIEREKLHQSKLSAGYHNLMGEVTWENITKPTLYTMR